PRITTWKCCDSSGGRGLVAKLMYLNKMRDCQKKVRRRAVSRTRTPPPKFIVLSFGAKMKMTLVHTARAQFTTFHRTVVPKVTCVLQNHPEPYSPGRGECYLRRL